MKFFKRSVEEVTELSTALGFGVSTTFFFREQNLSELIIDRRQAS